MQNITLLKGSSVNNVGFIQKKMVALGRLIYYVSPEAIYSRFGVHDFM